jgi:hypothetical protein
MKKMYFSALFMVFLINAGSSTALAAKAQNVLFVGNSDESTLTPGKYIASVDIQFIVADNIPKYVDTGLPILNVESFVDYVTKGSILGYTTAGELVFYSVLGGRKKQFSFTSGRQNPGCAGKAVVDANYVIALHDCNGEVYYSMEEAKSAHTNYHLEIVQGSLHMINTETSRKLWSIVPPGEVHFPLGIELFDFFFSAEFGDRELIAELEQGVIDIVNNLEVDEFGAHNERFLADEDDLDGRALEFFDDVKDYWVKGKVAVLSGQNKDLLRFDFAPLEITADIGSMWTDFMKKHKMLSSLGDHWLNSLKLRTFFTVPAWDETSKTASWGVRIRLQNLAGLVTSTPNQVRALKADLEVYMSFS